MKLIFILIGFITFSYGHPLNITKMVLDLNNSKFFIRFVSFNLEKPLKIQNPVKKDILDKEEEIVDYVKKHIKIDSCSLRKVDFRVKNEIVIDITFNLLCPKKEQLNLKFNLFFDFDKTQEGVMKITSPSFQKSLIFSIRKNSYTLKISDDKNYVKEFFIEGIWHILEGADHLLFLLMLILPVTLIDKSLRSSFFDILKIVTAFTIAHSVTLSLSIFNVLNPPERLIESLIALSVFLTALNNVKPVLKLKKEWILAFVFGFIHGFGFANALRELKLSFGSFSKIVFSFNLGVEAGQIAIVSLVFPVLFFLSKKGFYKNIYLFLVFAAMIISLFWFIDRSFGL